MQYIIKDTKKPLVSIVIPTYNRPEYFRQALESVLAQTYTSLDIFITDDSDDDRTCHLIQPYLRHDSRIHYEFHPEFDAKKNWARGMSHNNPDAEYVNWLMDDDLFLPEKIERMLNAYLENPNVALVTSYRQLIDSDSNIIPDLSSTAPVSEYNGFFDGQRVGRLMLISMHNFIGEPTTALIKKNNLKDNRLAWSGTEDRWLTPDIASWLACLEHGDLYYFKDCLSQFRLHAGQDQSNTATQMLVIISWSKEIEYAIASDKYLKKTEDKIKAMNAWLRLMSQFIEKKDISNCKDIDILEMSKMSDRFIRMLKKLRR